MKIMELSDTINLSEIYCKDSFFFTKRTIKEFIIQLVKDVLYNEDLEMILGFEGSIDGIITPELKACILDSLTQKL